MNLTKPLGFTLIELLLGMVILAIVGTLTAGALQATFRTQQSVDAVTALQETGTALLVKIRTDLSQTFHVESRRPLTRFSGEDNLHHDQITFTALAHYPSRPNARESDQTEITYKTVTNPNQTELYLLLRKETPRIDPEAVENDEDFIVVSDQVVEFDLSYSDGDRFLPSWDISKVEHLNKLPTLIRISLTLRDQQGREEIFETLVDIPMSQGMEIKLSSSTSAPPAKTPTLTPTPD